jgi:hypothetical protein
VKYSFRVKKIMICQPEEPGGRAAKWISYKPMGDEVDRIHRIIRIIGEALNSF